MSGAFLWRAIYSDAYLDEQSDTASDCAGGDAVHTNDDRTEHVFACIDQEHLLALVLIPQVPGLSTYVLKLTDGTRPIFFRRHQMTVNPLTGEEIDHTTVTCFGWQRSVSGETVAAYTFLFDDGSVVVSDDLQAV